MSKKTGKTARETAGFSLLELVIVLAVMAIVAAMAIPTWQRMQRNARLNGDGHSLSEALSVAKLRAAANFTESRVVLFTGTDQTPYFRIDVWNKTANTGSTGCWVPDGKANPTSSDCIANTSYTGNETFLSRGVSAGLANVTTAPDGTTAAQPNACKQGGSTPTTGGTNISNTSCIQFNSRGFPTAGAVFYITDSTRVYGISTNAMGLIHSYLATSSNGSTWKAY
jgi:prepilin-type N-terminal cleavage/methylation domain-containing protein